jgi:hypothetical protein
MKMSDLAAKIHAAQVLAGEQVLVDSLKGSGLVFDSPKPKAAMSPAWLPIATAPRDGQSILIRFGQDGRYLGKFVSYSSFPWAFIEIDDAGAWRINSAVDGPCGPSHWMPIPA